MSEAIDSHNRRAWDDLVQRGSRHAAPVTEAEFANPSPIINPFGWVGDDVAGRRVLCLAAGGGRHGVLYAAVGAKVTVVDLSGRMLELDRHVAARRGLTLRTMEASMDDLSMLEEAGFDLVIQPVSTCYVADIARVYREVARVTAPGGLYVSQHKQPASLQGEAVGSDRGYLLATDYFRAEPLPPVTGPSEHREPGTLEFVHSWEQLVGALCRSGFLIEDLIEPRHSKPGAAPGTFAHRSTWLPPYVALKARRTSAPAPPPVAPSLWTPVR
jgi:SAM-dependent methyltransferase